MSNKEIKFRAWDTSSNPASMLGPYEITDSIFNHKEVRSLELMQWTGKKDMHGKEIYEHDNVRILYTDWPSGHGSELSLEDYKKSISKYGLVIWDYEQACWVVSIYSEKYGEYLHSSIHPGMHGEIEVIGNKHQTP